MKRKNLMLTVAAAAVLGAFNPAFAGGNSAYQQDKDASAESSASVGAGASADSTAGGNVSPSSPSASTDGSATGDSTAAADLERDIPPDSEPDSELSELESTDRMAADEGQEGRDGPSEERSLN